MSTAAGDAAGGAARLGAAAKGPHTAQLRREAAERSQRAGETGREARSTTGAALYAKVAKAGAVGLPAAWRASRWDNVRRLHVHGARIQDFAMAAPVRARCFHTFVLVMVHCHVTMDDALQAVHRVAAAQAVPMARYRVAAVTCPCCNWGPLQTQLGGHAPDAEFEDPGVASPFRNIRLWQPRWFSAGDATSDGGGGQCPVATAAVG